MEQLKFKDPIKAQAAIAYLISQGWGIDLAGLRNKMGEDLKDKDWIDIANGCLDFTMSELAKTKVIPIFGFKSDLQ